MPDQPIRLPGLPEIQVKRNPRARTITLRYDRLNGNFRVSAPPSLSHGRITRFVDERRAWIAQHAAKEVARHSFEPGNQVPILGVPHEIAVVHNLRQPARVEGRLLFPASTPDVPARTVTYLKSLAREVLTDYSRTHAATLKPMRPLRSVQIRDTVSRWGSCSPRGVLSYSWRLVMAPEFVVDYLTAHEVAHLQHPHHKPTFWQACRALCPRTDEAKAWLKTHGAELHRYGPQSR